MVEDCSRGELLGWQEFVGTYLSIARRLLLHYFPTLAPELDAHLTRLCRHARENGNAWFAELRFANEREFLMELRALVFAYARAAARVPAPAFSLEQAQELLHDLSVVHRELLWMFVKGYDAAHTADMLMNAEATSGELNQRTRDRIAQVVERGASDLLLAAEKASTPDCLPLRTFNNLINGQISWQERDEAERHFRDCLYCLDRFTSFQEMIWYGRNAPPLGEPQVQRILRELGLSLKKKGLVARLFSKSA